MIRTEKELEFYIRADYMMNRGYFKPSFKQRLREFFFPDYIMDYLISMRKVDYYSNRGGYLLVINKIKFRRLSVKLGFSIPPGVFGYGLILPHYGTIVVGPNNKIGNYAVLHTSTCITSRPKSIGDNFYLSTGAKVITGEDLGDNIMISANSVVIKGCIDGNALLVGAPAYRKKTIPAWFEYQGNTNTINRILLVERLRKSIGL
ncbi:hypothetical protein [Prevotellamassilia timonensis]|uniref:hypothetical protein n=1 Tax=Prevotellamassilia timonensis TaxID=1852370 RepID=UPI001F4505FD|nr:hypothetical protein [Prevotellamassilia timonensis]MCF2634084.1 hypothetical protein [Prevotellamassilia timonensis]